MLAVAIVACLAAAAAGWWLFERNSRHEAPRDAGPSSAGPYRGNAVPRSGGATWETRDALPLESDRWKSLAASERGGGAGVPGLLLQIAESPRFTQRARDELFGLCLDGGKLHDVAFAVVPHLVAMSETLDETEHVRVLALTIAGAASARRDEAARAPSDLVTQCVAASRRARSWSPDTLPADGADLEHALGGLAALHDGSTPFASFADWGGDDGIGLEVACPTCRAREILVVGDRDAAVMDVDRDGEVVTRAKLGLHDRPFETALVTRGRALLERAERVEGDADLGALLAAIASHRGAIELTAEVASALATVECPSCRHRFVLTDGIRATRK